MPPAGKPFQDYMPRIEKIHAVAARLFKRQVLDCDIVDAAQGKEMPVLAVAVAAWIQIVAAVHGEPCTALAANDDVARILDEKQAIRLSYHRARLCAHYHAVGEHQLHVRGHANRFDQPLRSLPVDDNLRRTGVNRRLQALSRILRIPAEGRRHGGFARHTAA